MIFFAFLSGAVLGALIDALAGIPVAQLEGVRVGYFLFALGSTSIAALIGAVGMALAPRVPGLGWSKSFLEEGRAFWPGLLFGLIPLIAYPLETTLYLPGRQHWANLAMWVAMVLVFALVARRLPSTFAAQAKFQKGVLSLGVALFVVAYLLPGELGAGMRTAPEIAAEAETAGPQVGEAHPDLVLVSIDTLRADLGHRTEFLLPVIEELRPQAAWADYGISPSNQTVPGHVAMLTGLEHGQHGVSRNAERAQLKSLPYVAPMLRDFGYRTAAVVSNPMMLSRHGWSDGYEVYDDFDAEPGGAYFFVQQVGRLGWPSVVLGAGPAKILLAKLSGVSSHDIQPPAQSLYATASAERTIGELATGAAPYHLFVHYMDPHAPYTAPEETAGKFASPEDLPQEYERWIDDQRLMMNRIKGALKEDERDPVAMQAIAHLRDLYDEEILFMDSQLRRLLAAIEAGGRPTLLIVTSDHGEFFGENGQLEHSKHLYGPVVRVPFMALGLNGATLPARKLDDPVNLIDVVPTMLDAAGMEVPENLRGRSLLAEDFPPIDHVGRWSRMASIRRGPYKILVELQAEGQVEVLGVYQLDTDPTEQGGEIDLDGVPEFERLMARLERLAVEVAEWDAQFPSGETFVADRVLMEALGYFDTE